MGKDWRDRWGDPNPPAKALLQEEREKTDMLGQAIGVWALMFIVAFLLLIWVGMLLAG